MNFEKSDIITCESYKGLCDYVYAGEPDPPAGLVHCNLEELTMFFEAIKNYPDRDYVVVSSCSDFGVGYLAEQPPWMDMRRWAQLSIGADVGCMGLQMPPRFEPKKFNENHKYTVKCYSYTAYTFPEIPGNVHKWFMTNSMINPVVEPVIEVIPFGVAGKSADRIYDAMTLLAQVEKQDKIYINWNNYTYERYLIKENYLNLSLPYVTIINEAKDYEDYLVDLSMHRFVLCPDGNGIDCYRTLEAIYMGALPICMPSATTLTLMNGLDTIVTKTLMGIPSEAFGSMYEWRVANATGNPYAKLSYWKGRFEEERAKWLI